MNSSGPSSSGLDLKSSFQILHALKHIFKTGEPGWLSGLACWTVQYRYVVGSSPTRGTEHFGFPPVPHEPQVPLCPKALVCPAVSLRLGI